MSKDKITMHDIEANGKKFILQWYHSDDDNGYIMITEACDDPDNEDGCDHETHDFKEVQ